ncbi:MAG: DUF4292 domain-containing protein [Bacteroidota bacterium]
MAEGDFRPSSAEISEILNQLPDYSSELTTATGKGRAIVSEPENTERVTILFSSNRQKSLVTIRNGIGIEGGQLLTDGDSLLIYNKVDKYARKVPVESGKLDRINRLASLNILDMMNYSVSEEQVQHLLESESSYQLQLQGGGRIFIDKDNFTIRKIEQPRSSNLPYSIIEYDSYAQIEGFTLPRRISIFGSEGESKVALQITSLDLNTELDSLTITIPDDIDIFHE